MATFSDKLCQGWVWKKKSEGSKSRFLSQYNKRYLTLDFSQGLFFYSHDKKDKKVSMPVKFSQLLGSYAVAGPEGRTLLDRMSSGSEFCTTTGLHLHMRFKDMELYFATEAEAGAWLRHFERAVVMGIRMQREASPSRATSATSCRSEGTESTVATSGACTPSEGLLASQAAFPPATPEQAQFQQAQLQQAQLQQAQLQQAQLQQAQLQQAQFRAQQAQLQQAHLEQAQLQQAQLQQVTEQLPSREEEADALGAETVPEVSLPAPVAVPKPVEQQGWAAPKQVPGSSPTKSYGDRGAGMSVQERMAALEFSDYDSDSDDNMLANPAAAADAIADEILGTEPVAEPLQAPPAPAAAPATQPAQAVLEREHSWDEPDPAEALLVREHSWDD